MKRSLTKYRLTQGQAKVLAAVEAIEDAERTPTNAIIQHEVAGMRIGNHAFTIPEKLREMGLIRKRSVALPSGMRSGNLFVSLLGKDAINELRQEGVRIRRDETTNNKYELVEVKDNGSTTSNS